MNYTIVVLSILIAYSSDFVQGDNYQGYIFSKDFALNSYMQSDLDRFTPTKIDIEKGEMLISRKLDSLFQTYWNDGNTYGVIDGRLEKYNRQYFGLQNERNEKIIWVNMLWGEDIDISELKDDLIIVFDGGGSYWKIKVNIDSNIVFDLEVNGGG